MELIPYAQFATLRLTDFTDEPTEIVQDDNVKHDDGVWITQRLPGDTEWHPASFFWRKEAPDSLVSLTLAVPIPELASVQKVIKKLGLPFTPEMRWPAIRRVLGEPYDVSSMWGRGGEIYTFRVGRKAPYRLDFYAAERSEPAGVIMKPWSNELL